MPTTRTITDFPPPPPVLGPYPDPSFPNPPRNLWGQCAYQLWKWVPADNKWEATASYEAWDAFPLGYYSWYVEGDAGDGAVIVVLWRVDPNGVQQPNVLKPPQPPQQQSPQCPDGYFSVPASVLEGLDPGGEAGEWVQSTDPQNYCIPLAIVSQPVCPPGQHYDPQSESCKPNVTIPVCPPGTLWDPVSGTCQVVSVGKQQPPPTCPPGTVWNPNTETCDPIITPDQPCIPNPSPWDDELKNGLDCISENLIVIQQLLQQMQQGGGGDGGGTIDPVTCAQVTAAANAIVAAIGALTSAVTAGAGAGEPVIVNAPVTVNVPTQPAPTVEVNTTPPDLTAIVDQLMKLVTEGDVANSTFQWLQQQGYLTPEDLQLYQGLGWADSFFAMLRTLASRVVTNFLAAFGFTITGGKPVYTGLEAAWATGMKESMASFLAVNDATLAPVVARLVNTIAGQLTAGGSSGIGVIGVNPDTVVSDALGITFAAAAGAYLLAFVGIDQGEPLAHIAELVSAAIGFEEIRDVKIGPLIRQGVGLVAERQAKATFQQELPGTTALLGYVAQGLMTPIRAQALSLLNGTSDELFPIEAAAAFRGFNARQMLRLIETNLFSQAEIADELTFSAMRPVSQARMLRAAPFLATASERSSLLAAVEAAAVAGLLADSDVTAQYDAAQSNEDPHSLILSRLHLQQAMSTAKDLEAEYTTLFTAGIIDQQTFNLWLVAATLQPWKISNVIAKAEARANATLQRKELAQAAAVVKATNAAVVKDATKNFMESIIDAGALATALTATGLTVAQVTALVDLAVLQKGGGLQWIYGLQLPKPQAAILRGRVAALTDQRKRLQITDPQYVSQLQVLGLGPRYVNWLQAAADALISPKTSAFAIPVSTN